jgi:small subunit ribosomal protein S6
MRRYETFVILDPDLSQDQREQVIQRVEELITQMDGFLVLTDDWGERRLAYEIKKRPRGYYVRFDYCGLSSLVNEIERFFRIDDRALKYMTVLLDKTADLEKIKAEKAAAESTAEIEEAPQETSREVETPTVEDTVPVEEEAPADVAPASDESDAAADTTPLKNPEEA